jgi:uncharacterized Zn-finger protein
VGAPDPSAGQEARCPYCGEVVRVPAPPGKERPLDGDDLAALTQGQSLEHPEPPARHKDAHHQPLVHMEKDEKTSVCPRCGTIYPAGLVCPQCRGVPAGLSLWERFPVGKLIAMLVIVAVLGGLMYGVMWVFKNLSQTGGTYFETVQQAQQTAYDVVCMERLRVLGQDIQMHITMNDRLPQDLGVLGRPDLLRCPAPNGGPYEYMHGLRTNMPGVTILAYEPQPTHDGRHAVLRLDGTVEMLTDGQLQTELGLTKTVRGY